MTLLLPILLLLPLQEAGKQAPDSRIDEGLDRTGSFLPIFARFSNQLLPTGRAFTAFCRDHARDPRSKLRPWVLKELRQRSEEGWKKVAGLVAKLEKKGSIQNVMRFWIVGGFACDAKTEAIRELAKSKTIDFIYRQRVVMQHRVGGRGRNIPGRMLEQRRDLLEKTLKDWRDDSGDPLPRKLDIPWNVERIQAPEAWRKLGATGRGVVIALLDTGLLPTPALTKALWRNPGEKLDGKDNDGNGWVDDIFGYDFLGGQGLSIGDSPRMPHGSVCAGIMVGRPAGRKNTVTGLAPRARIMVLRGMGCLKAYEYALEMGADILSMSYMWVRRRLGHYRGLFRTAHEHLAAGGIVSVGGAGNFGGSGRRAAPPGRQIAIPKDIPCVIAAAGILKDGSKARASSEGPCYWNDVRFFEDFPPEKPLPKPDVTGFFGGYPTWCLTKGPFSRMWRTLWEESPGIGLVVGPQGNSFSGPHAGGVAALMLSANPELNAWEVKDILERTCKDIGEKGRDRVFGAGLMQAYEAVKAARAVKKK